MDLRPALTFVAAAAAFAGAVYAWRQRHTRGARPFACASLAGALWMAGDAIARLAPPGRGQLAGELVRFAGITAIPLAVFVFTRQYCGSPLSRSAVAALAVVPLVSWTMAVTNRWHHLFWTGFESRAPGPPITDFGPYFWLVHTPYSYGLMLLSIGTVLFEISRAARHYRRQLVVLLAAFCVPLAVNVLTLAGVTRGRFVTLGIAVFLLTAAAAVFRYHVLGGNPIAYETAFQTMREGVILVDRAGAVTDINRAAERGLAVSSRQAAGHPFAAVVTAAGIPAAALEAANPHLVEAHYGGARRWLEIEVTPLPADAGRLVTLRDVTDSRRSREALEAMAFRDPLTGLPNRRRFQETADRAIAAALERTQPLAILFVDLNHFKEVNDALGHAVGDELLKSVAARMRSALRGSDVLARLGGDEFGLLLHDAAEADVELVVRRIFAALDSPITIQGRPVAASLSVGAALCPRHGRDLPSLMRCADEAMYAAKAAGGGLRISAP